MKNGLEVLSTPERIKDWQVNFSFTVPTHLANEVSPATRTILLSAFT